MGTKVNKFVLINCGRIEHQKPELDSEYAKLLKKEKDRTLKKDFPQDSRNAMNEHANNYHTESMMYERDEKDNLVLKPELLGAKSDRDGEIEIDGTPEGEEYAKFLIKTIRVGLKRDCKLAKHSMEFSVPWDYEKLFPVSVSKKEKRAAITNGLDEEGRPIGVR